ncbi:hypothetical protein L7F22_027948 [Adiantum nelumboides]|nr:hypothetical protein [Adiantum nelumboides]
MQKICAQDREQNGACCSCSEGVGARWAVGESFEEMDFHRSLAGAAVSNDISRMQHILHRGIPADMPDANGYTPLHYAARNGHLDACLLLLENGAQVDKCTRSGKATSLHRAAYAGHIEVVKTLIKAGADVFKKDSDGRRPVEKAEAQGHVEIVNLLVDAACKLEQKVKDIDCI